MQGGFKKFMDSSQKAPSGNYLKGLKKNLNMITKYLTPHKKNLFFAVLATIVVAGTAMLNPYLMKAAIDDYIMEENLSGLALISLLMLACYGLAWLFSYWQTYLSGKVGQKIVAELREDLFDHLKKMELSFYHKSRTGEILSRVTHDINNIAELITNGFVHLVSDILTILGILVIMFFLDPWLTLFIFILLPLVTIIFLALGKKMRQAYHRVQEEMARLNTDVEENVTGIRTIKALNIEDKNYERFRRLSFNNMKANLKAVGIFSLFFPAMNFSRVLGEAMVLGFGGLQVIQGNITLGILAAFLGYVRRFFTPIMDLSQVYNTYQAAGASLDRINEYFNLSPGEEINEAKSEYKFSQEKVRGEIIFEGVSFSYPDIYKEDKVLKDFNLYITPYKTVSLVGPSGAGKSTVTKLLTRLYKPSEGRILIDGHDLQRIPPWKIREVIGVFSQNIQLFNRTIEENIRYGNFEASFDEVEEAAKKAHAHEFIDKLPGKYKAAVGKDGVKLSGGQKQLIALARIFLKDPKILVLDEPTSNVDTYTEGLLLEATQKLLKEKTVLVISHRLSTIKAADEVIFLRDGKIQDRGNHDELIKKNPEYSNLFESHNYNFIV